MDIWKDFVKQTVSAVASSGTGAFTLSTAVSGFQALGAGDDAGTGFFTATEGTKWQTFLGTYTNSGTSLARTTPIDGSAGAATNETFTTAAVVFLAPNSFSQRRRYAVEQAITGTTTAAWGQSYLCTGTSANYTVTLPTAVGHAGERMRFRMGSISALSKLVTLDANSTETINGSLTRIMWADEVCELESDGTNLIKVGGVSLPMCAAMSKSANQGPITVSTDTLVTCDTANLDNTGVMVNTSTHFLNIKRPGKYAVSAFIDYDVDTALLVQCIVKGGASGTTALGTDLSSSASSANCGPSLSLITTAALADQIGFYAYSTGTTRTLLGGDANGISVTEIISW